MDNEVRDLKEKIKRLENRISQLENRWQIPGRIDLRFMRLEILSYYHSKGRYWQLDEERRRILDDLENLDDDLDFFKNFGRVFFQEYYFTKDKSVDLPKPNPIDIQEKDGSYFWSIRGGGRCILLMNKGGLNRLHGGFIWNFFSQARITTSIWTKDLP